MSITAKHARQVLCWSILLTAVLSFVSADTVLAQRSGGGMRRGGGGRKKAKDPKRPQEHGAEEKAPAPGSQIGYIVSFKPADEESRKEDEDLLGVLKLKPFAKKASVLVIQVRRHDDLSVKLGEHKFDLDNLTDALKKRLHVSVDWDFLDPDSKRPDKYKKKTLRSMTLQTIEVDGEITEMVEGKGLVVSGYPADDKQWPDFIPDENKKNMAVKVRKRKLKLRVVEDVSKFVTEDIEDAAPSDFKEGDKVRVTVVYAGGKPGILVKMRPPGVNDVKRGSKDDEGANKPPQPPTRGPKPRGRGGASGG